MPTSLPRASLPNRVIDEVMPEDLRKRLRDLGVVRGLEQLTSRPSRPRFAIEDITDGRFHTTSRGRCFIVEADYDLAYLHGMLPLSAFLEASSDAAGWEAIDPSLSGIDLRRACFLDTETTGLSAATGTMAFVVGLGYFTEAHFCVRQYFLRDPGDEPAMIEALADSLPAFAALASFNGLSFDVPILENRFILARLAPPTTGIPHLDLLRPARRIWRFELPSCSLGTLEREVLGVLREQDDVPSGVIPLLYRDYLRTGDARDMKRVLYHNAVDILSLVTLAARIRQAVSMPYGPEGLSDAGLYGLGRWYTIEGRLTQAEEAYRAAIHGDLAPEVRSKALHALADMLKRANRPAEAFALWQQLALEGGSDARGRVRAHVELAKQFEWHLRDLPLAAAWTRAAVTLVQDWPLGPQRDATLAELRHRLARLERKISASGDQASPASG